MTIALTLKNNKYFLVDTQKYNIDNKVFVYNDKQGQHFIPFHQIQSWKFGNKREKLPRFEMEGQ